MEQYQDIVSIIALTLGVSWASGINLYAAMLTLGALGAGGHVDLPHGLQVLSDPLVIGAAGLMYAIEFFADKMPGVDTGWDTLHTFIRIPAGAVLAASAVGDIGPAVQLAAAIVGGSLAAGAHFSKAGSRLLINTSPEPVSNWAASVAEDAAVVGSLWLALNHPAGFVCVLALFVAAMMWLLPKLWRAIVRTFHYLNQRLNQKPYLAGRHNPADVKRLSAPQGG